MITDFNSFNTDYYTVFCPLNTGGSFPGSTGHLSMKLTSDLHPQSTAQGKSMWSYLLYL